jgi:signal recognition particle receptor subunit beta
MAFSNFETKEVNCKILYLGPPGSGKTANLRSILSKTSPDIQSGLFELSDQTSAPTAYFDFLPISIGHFRDFHVKLHLISMPMHAVFDTLPMVLLRGIDGFAFIADSRIESLPDNIDCMMHLRKVLTDEGYNISDMPKVIQYNKRDLSDVVPLDILRQELNAAKAPDFESVAIKSMGTMETLNSLANQVLKKIGRLN